MKNVLQKLAMNFNGSFKKAKPRQQITQHITNDCKLNWDCFIEEVKRRRLFFLSKDFF